jgi:hypothetical protein
MALPSIAHAHCSHVDGLCAYKHIANSFLLSLLPLFAVDTDTVFITAVMAGDIFVAGKPRVVVTYGEPKDRFWAQVPKSTHLAVGKKEPFRAMTYFPVVIKTSHLRLMREHIKGTMRAPSFDAAMASIISEGAYSQFNIMATYLWWFHHEEYCWDVMERTPGWKGPVPEVGW